jgi:hypothetical protein
MTAPNSSYTDLILTTLEYMGDEIVDNVSNNNAATAWLKANDGWGTIEGGQKIVEPLAYGANSNAGWYSGADQLPVALQEEFSGAEFPWKQISAQIVSTGLELDVQNVGKAARFNLLKERIKNARRSIANTVATGFFSDGTGSGGKQLTGVLATCSATPTTGTYGGINRATATNAFWRNKYTDTGAVPTSTTIQGLMNTMWYSLVRGADKPKLIIGDDDVAGAYEASLQANQRFTDPKMAELGFENLKYKSAVFVMDGNCTDKTAFFLNTDYLNVRVAQNRNFKALPKREAFNQDIEVVLLAAALNLTCSNAILQGRLEFTV